MSFTQRNVGTQPISVYTFKSDDDNISVLNTSETVTVSVGSVSNIEPGDVTTFPLGPGDAQTFSGPGTLWAVAPATATIALVPGGSDYSPGSISISGGLVDVNVTNSSIDVDVQGTADINVTNASIDVAGVGGYINPGSYTLLASDATSHSVAPSAAYTSAVINVTNYQSFSAQIQAYCSSQSSVGGPLVIPVAINYWADSAGTLLVDSELWWMWIANSSANAPNMPFRISAPLKGGYISFSFVNDSDETFDISNQQLYGSGRSLTVADARQISPAGNITASGITLLTSSAPIVPLPGTDNILANEGSNTLASSSTYWYPLPLMAGTVSVRFLSSTTLAHDFIIGSAAGLLNPDVIVGTGAQGIVFDVVAADATTQQTATLYIGHAPLYITIATTGSGATFTLLVEGTQGD